MNLKKGDEYVMQLTERDETEYLESSFKIRNIGIFVILFKHFINKFCHFNILLINFVFIYQQHTYWTFFKKKFMGEFIKISLT